MAIFEVVPGIRYYLDDGIARVLDKKRKLVNTKDRDYFFIVDGSEGAGKSWLTFQLAKYLDPSFNLSRVAMNGKEFMEAIRISRKGNAIVFDEAFTGLSARASMSEINKILIETIMEVRKKNLFVFIVLPTIFFLDRYITLSRGKVLFHTYFVNEQRGHYCVYNQKRLKQLVLKGRKGMSYNVTKPNVRCKFSGKFALDKGDEKVQEKLYTQKKIDAVNNKSGKDRLKEKHIGQRDALILMLLRLGKSQDEIINHFETEGYAISKPTLTEIVTRLRSLGKLPPGPRQIARQMSIDKKDALRKANEDKKKINE